METVRTLGFAARFVSSYLYDESRLSGGAGTVVGGGVTHAWLRIYLARRGLGKP